MRRAERGGGGEGHQGEAVLLAPFAPVQIAERRAGAAAFVSTDLSEASRSLTAAADDAVLQEKEREKELILFSGELVVKMPIWGVGLTPWLKTKVVDPLMQIIRRGAEPKQLAFSAALGVTLGVFPICGTTVFLCGAAIGLFGNRCHAPSVMLANFVATPIELSLVVPFLRLGEVISGGPHFPLTSDALMKVVTGEASRDVLISVLHALLGWIVAAPFILGALYVVFVPCFKFLISRFNAAPSSPKKQRAI
ncbi:unnamed protein product [Musa hybrid cultivar]